MCRSIRPLFNFDPPVTEDEIRAASLQFVRKISGYHKPSKANEAPFLAAIDEISGAAARLLHSLDTTAPPTAAAPAKPPGISSFAASFAAARSGTGSDRCFRPGRASRL